jgi:hypothetical protein
MKKIARLLTGLFVAAVVLIPIAQAGAQSTAIGINPRKELTVQPGATQKDTLSITNPLKENDISLELKVIDFSAKDQSGTPKLDLNDNTTTPWSLKKFIDLPKTISIKAGQTANVPFSVTIPANQGAGSYYSAIQYKSNNPGDGNVTINAAATTLVFVNVPGDALERMSLRQLGAFSGDLNSTEGSIKLFYFGNQPKVISYVLNNEGNVAERPVGSILVKNSFTGKTIKIDDANPNNAVALRGQERRFDACIKAGEKVEKTATGETSQTVCEDPGLTPGRYTITLSAFYGQSNGKSLEVSGVSSFWYLPTWFVIAIVVVVLAIVALVWWIVTKIKDRTPARRR